MDVIKSGDSQSGALFSLGSLGMQLVCLQIYYYCSSEDLHIFRSLGKSGSELGQKEAVCVRVGVYVNLNIINITIELENLIPNENSKGNVLKE